MAEGLRVELFINMELIALSSKCFNAVERALEAVKSGDARLSVVALQSVQKDGQLLQKKAAILIDQLSKAEKDHQQKVEGITRQMNELYSEETQLATKKQALYDKISSLADQKQSYYQNKEEASRKYEAAKRAKRDAERKYEEMKIFFLVPVVGQILALTEEHTENASVAHREMMRYERDVEEAENEVRLVDSQISQSERDLKEISQRVEKLRKEREACHEKLSDIKNMTSFIMQAVGFWDKFVAVTKEATIETEHLERIVKLAGKKTNRVRILRGGGTQTKMTSFKERWMEVAEMNSSDGNNVTFKEGLGAYSVSKTALLGLTKVLANECAPMGVRVNCVAPGVIKTRFSEAFWKNESLLEQLLRQIPLGRVGMSEDIGGAVSFLSSDQASFFFFF